MLIFVIYEAYIAWDEYKLYSADVKSGIEELKLELLCIENRKPAVKGAISIPIYVFKHIYNNKIELINLSGNVGDIKLKVGSLYLVSFYRNTQWLVEIKEIKK